MCLSTIFRLIFLKLIDSFWKYQYYASNMKDKIFCLETRTKISTFGSRFKLKGELYLILLEIQYKENEKKIIKKQQVKRSCDIFSCSACSFIFALNLLFSSNRFTYAFCCFHDSNWRTNNEKFVCPVFLNTFSSL